MFYSHCLLSRKGPLGAVLIAAYCHSRLKKSQVLKADIPFSIKKIIDEGFQSFTYRILGYLLLGVVRIYSQKVEYVLLDCNQMLLKAKQAIAAKQREAHASSFIASHQFITLPESLDLDKFIFEDIGVEHRDHVLPREEIMLKDTWANEEALNFSTNGLFGVRVSIDLETFSDSRAGTPNHDSIGLQHQVDMPLDDTFMSDMEIIERGLETLVQKFASTADTYNVEMGYLQAHLSSSPVISSVNNETNEAQSTKQVEAEPSEGEREFATKLYVTVERPPEMHLHPSDGVGAKAMPTPVSKERVPIKRKRKCQIDEQIILSNKTVKDNIDYSRDLVRKQLRVPETALGVWKHGLFINLEKNFTRMLINCVLPDPNWCSYQYKLTPVENSPNLGASNIPEIPILPSEAITDIDRDMVDGLPVFENDGDHIAMGTEIPVVEKAGGHIAMETEIPVVEKEGDHTAMETEIPVFEKAGDHIAMETEKPVVEKERDHIAIAPETPHQESRIKRFPVAEAFERIREASLSHTSDDEVVMEQYEELSTEVCNSSAVDFQEPDGWSASTRQAVRDLSSAFKGGKQETEQVNLDEALRGKSTRTSAKMFYDILVLLGRGMVNIQQDKPYGEILVTKSATWETHICAEQ